MWNRLLYSGVRREIVKMTKRWIAWMTAAVLAIGLMGPVRAEAAEVYSEDFESMVPGSVPDGFAVSPGENSEISVRQADGNRYVYFLSRKNEETKLTKTLNTPAAGIVTLEQSVLVAQNFNDGHKFFSLKNAAGKYIGMVMESNGDLVLRTGSAPYQILVPDYRLNTWYDIKLAANTASQRIAAYVDGRLACADIPFWNSADSITAIEAYAQGSNRGMCIDNVRITAENPDSYTPVVSAVTVTGRKKALAAEGAQGGRSIRFLAQAADQCGAVMEDQPLAWSLAPESERLGFAVDQSGTVTLPDTLTEDCSVTVTASAGQTKGSFTTRIIRSGKTGVNEDFEACGTDGLCSDYMLSHAAGGRAEILYGNPILKGAGAKSEASRYRVNFPAVLRNTVIVSCDVQFSAIAPWHNIITCHDYDVMIVTYNDGSLTWRGKDNVYTPIYENYQAGKKYNIKLEIPYPSGEVTAYVTPEGGETVTTSGLLRRNGNSGMGNFESYTQETAQYVIDNLQIYEKGAETAQNLRISGPDTVYIPDFSEVLSYGYQAGLENPVFGTAETAEGVSWTAEGPAGVSIDPVTGRLSVARGTEPGGSVTVTAELAEERVSTTVLLAPNTPEYTGIDLFRYQDQSAAARVAVRKPQAEETWMRLVLAVYDQNGQLVGVVPSMREEADKSDETQYARTEGQLIEVRIPAEDLDGGMTARAFVWNTLDEMVPLTPASLSLNLEEAE